MKRDSWFKHLLYYIPIRLLLPVELLDYLKYRMSCLLFEQEYIYSRCGQMYNTITGYDIHKDDT